MDVLRILLVGLHFIVSLVLIALVVAQNSRSEGLGAVGGASGPSLRGRAGLDEQLATYTKYVAITFMTLSAILYLCARKYGWS
jgi:protein translocase SecG subunit